MKPDDATPESLINDSDSNAVTLTSEPLRDLPVDVLVMEIQGEGADVSLSFTEI